MGLEQHTEIKSHVLYLPSQPGAPQRVCFVSLFVKHNNQTQAPSFHRVPQLPSWGLGYGLPPCSLFWLFKRHPFGETLGPTGGLPAKWLFVPKWAPGHSGSKTVGVSLCLEVPHQGRPGLLAGSLLHLHTEEEAHVS